MSLFTRIGGLIFIATFFLNCSDKVDVKVVDFNNEYSIELPNYLKRVEGLNSEASLQYMNTINGVCVMVIEEPKSNLTKLIASSAFKESYSDSLEGYADIFLNQIDKKFSIIGKPIIQNSTIKNNKFVFLSFNVRLVENDIYYDIALVEGTGKYYQVYTWVPVNGKVKEQNSMRKVLESFEEL
ncbi:hypothetical protein [Myroides phaeus]|uniref:hypothetical protein n=1 Tax=Myroides phaeus TaxID=702745 RepID=UPI001303D7B4|nr:hypothetical protein [Myroides phaeus]